MEVQKISRKHVLNLTLPTSTFRFLRILCHASLSSRIRCWMFPAELIHPRPPSRSTGRNPTAKFNMLTRSWPLPLSSLRLHLLWSCPVLGSVYLWVRRALRNLRIPSIARGLWKNPGRRSTRRTPFRCLWLNGLVSIPWAWRRSKTFPSSNPTWTLPSV